MREMGLVTKAIWPALTRADEAIRLVVEQRGEYAAFSFTIRETIMAIKTQTQRLAMAQYHWGR